MVMNDIDPGANLVFALGPPHIVGSGEAPVIAECRIPALGIPNVCETGNSEEREPAAAQVRTVVGSWKAQHIRADVSSVIRSLAVFAHARKANVSVYHQGRRKRERVADRNKLHKRMEIAQAAVACAVANRLTQTRHAMKYGLHSAVLDEDAVIRGAIPINFAIEVVAIQALRC